MRQPAVALGWTLFSLLLGSEPRTAVAESFEVPFRLEHHEILLEVEIGGRGPFTFLLDTALTPSSIDVDVAREAGFVLDEESAVEASGLGSKRVLIYPTTIEGLRLAGREIGPLRAMANSLAGLSEKVGEPLHGILGYAFLEGRVVRIDYAAGRLTIARTAEELGTGNGSGSHVVPMEFGANDIVPVVRIGLGEHLATVTLDTGSALGLEIFTPYVEELGLGEVSGSWARSVVMGARGEAEARDGELPRVELGPFDLADVPTSITPARGTPYRQGNLGNQVLERFVLTLDYAGRTVGFTLAPGDADSPRSR